MVYRTNSSVTKLAGDNDPIEVMQKRVRELVLNAIQEGWAGQVRVSHKPETILNKEMRI